ncbi:hypothetical protein C4K04_0016 [Pseudomonas chlororaphis]|uniref:Uncharacterized protein n=1 Tax=Pseudomonas chlororaphis TaxID=587753 RepID=A0A3G7TF56_9PSED|nr:hypothetical protein C4K04_0016 [Pseudomonas chlororaphis]
MVARRNSINTNQLLHPRSVLNYRSPKGLPFGSPINLTESWYLDF